MLLNCVLPEIREKWPINRAGKDGRNKIFVQQDIAKTHDFKNDAALSSALIQGSFDIQLLIQPPNILGMNVLHLGIFRTIQSLQHQLMDQDNIKELITATTQAF